MGHGGSNSIVAVFDDEDTIIMAGYREIKRYHLDNGELLVEYKLHNDHYDVMQYTIRGLILSPDLTEIVELLTPKEADGEVLLIFLMCYPDRNE